MTNTQALHFRCTIPAPKAKKSRGMKKAVSVKKEVPQKVPESSVSSLDVAALVPVPIIAPSSPLRNNSLHSLKPVPVSVNYNFEETARRISFDLPIAPEFRQDDKDETNDKDEEVDNCSMNVRDEFEPCKTSPKPSEAIDDECDDTEEYVTLDTSVLALPSAIDTSWATLSQN